MKKKIEIISIILCLFCSLTADAEAFNIYYAQPKGFFNKVQSINLAVLLIDYLQNKGTFNTKEITTGVLKDKTRYIFNRKNLTDVDRVIEFFKDTKDIKRKVINENLNVLDSPWEFLFQLKNEPVDYIKKSYDLSLRSRLFLDANLTKAKYVTYINEKGVEIDAIEFEDSPFSKDLMDYEAIFGALIEIDLNGEKGYIYNFARTFYEFSRFLNLLKTLKSQDNNASLTLFLGSNLQMGSENLYLKKNDIDELINLSLKTLDEAQINAVLPLERDLRQGKAKFLELSRKIPYIAWNLTVDDQKIPGYKIFNINDNKIMVLGMLSPDTLKNLGPVISKEFKISEIRDAYRNALKLIDELNPDLVILLTNCRGDDYTFLSESMGIDVLIGNSPMKWDISSSFSETKPIDSWGKVRFRRPILNLTDVELKIGKITVTMEDNKINKFVVENHPVTEKIEPVPEIMRELNSIEMKYLSDLNKKWLPDISTKIKKDSELASLIWGKVYRNGSPSYYEEKYPARFTDNLWMHFVTNITKRRLKVNGVIFKNIPRGADTIGPIIKALMIQWVMSNDQILVYKITGEELLNLLKIITHQEKIFLSGIDPTKGIIEGRRIDPKETYEIAVSNTLFENAEILDIFKLKDKKEFFIKKDNTYVAGAKGKTLLVRDVVLDEVNNFINPETKQFDDKKEKDFYANFGFRSREIVPRFKINIQNLGFVLSANYAENIDSFQKTREVRATTPDYLSYGGQGDIFLEYDDKYVDWQNRVQGTYQTTSIIYKGQTVSQKSADDLAFTSDLALRFLNIGSKFGGETIELDPFISVKYDTEFTPTKNQLTSETYPLQKVLYGDAGFVLKPGRYLNYIKLYFVGKNDFSQEKGRFESGIGLDFLFTLPVKYLSFSNEFSTMYFVPQKNDSIEDLGFILRNKATFSLQIYKFLALQLFADAFLTKGKVTETDTFGSSLQIGSAINISGLSTVY